MLAEGEEVGCAVIGLDSNLVEGEVELSPDVPRPQIDGPSTR